MFQYKNCLILDDLGVPWGILQIQVAFFSLARRCNLSDLSVSSGKSCDRLWPHGVLAFFVWSTVHNGNSYAATFRHALGCCSWVQCWMNLLERVSQKYDRQLVELTEPFALRKWSNIVRKAKAVTTYYSLLQPQNMIRRMFWIWSHQDAIEMAWHMSAGYVSYIARELATSRIRRLRAMGRVGAGAACVNHLGAVLIFAETSWKVLKHVDTGNMLNTCWIHVGFRPGPHAHWANDSNTLFFCEPPLGQDHPSQMSPYRVEPFSPWSRRSRGSCGSTAPGRSGSRTRRSWRWRVQHASPVIPLKQEISETAARKKSHITENST